MRLFQRHLIDEELAGVLGGGEPAHQGKGAGDKTGRRNCRCGSAWDAIVIWERILVVVHGAWSPLSIPDTQQLKQPSCRHPVQLRFGRSAQSGRHSPFREPLLGAKLNIYYINRLSNQAAQLAAGAFFRGFLA